MLPIPELMLLSSAESTKALAGRAIVDRKRSGTGVGTVTEWHVAADANPFGRIATISGRNLAKAVLNLPLKPQRDLVGGRVPAFGRRHVDAVTATDVRNWFDDLSATRAG